MSQPGPVDEPGPHRSPDAVGLIARVQRDALAALPTISRLSTYSPRLLRDDVVAGLVLTAVLIPIGMGYAEGAGLPAASGLYATVGALVAYFLVGPSRTLVFAPDSALLPLVAAAVLPLAGGDDGRAVALASALAIIVGALCLAGSIARLGFISDLFSRPTRVGYMNGIALTILVSQLPKALGFATDARDVVGGVTALARGISEGRVVPLAAAIATASLAIILLLRHLAPRWPAVLLAAVGSGALVAVLGLAPQLDVVGEVPRGLPDLGLPAISGADLVELFPAALAIAVVTFTSTSVISRSFSARRGERVDVDHELAALGVVNVAVGLVGGFASGASATRTPVADAAGARTQVAGLVGAIAIVILLVALPGLLSPVPTAGLAAIVVVAALDLFDLRGLARLWRLRPSELVLALVAFLAVILLGVLPGIAAAVGLSLLNFVRRAWRPHDAVLGRVTGSKGYHDIVRHPEARLVPGLVLFRWDAPLFFANAEAFRERTLATVGQQPPPVRWLAIAAEPVTDIDTTAADMLDDLVGALARRGVELHFAELKGNAKDRLRAYGIFGRLGEDHFHPTVGSVVKSYLAAHPEVRWRDWEDDLASGAPGEPGKPGVGRPAGEA